MTGPAYGMVYTDSISSAPSNETSQGVRLVSPILQYCRILISWGDMSELLQLCLMKHTVTGCLLLTQRASPMPLLTLGTCGPRVTFQSLPLMPAAQCPGEGWLLPIPPWSKKHKEGQAPKNWWFEIVMLEKTPDLDYKKIKPVNLKGSQSWTFTVRIVAKLEIPILWPPDVESWLTERTLKLGKIEGKKGRGGRSKDEIVGWHHWLNGHEFEQTPGRWWRTGKPGVLQSTGSQRVGTGLGNHHNVGKYRFISFHFTEKPVPEENIVEMITKKCCFFVFFFCLFFKRTI